MAWLNESAGPGVATWIDDNANYDESTNNIWYDNGRAYDTSGLADSASVVANQAQTGTSEYADLIREIYDRAEYNNAQSAAAADKANAFTSEQNQLAMQFSASEAAKNREWQENLSNTAHQREVEDLIAAGLNPILSVNAGASTGSGSTGQGFSGSGQKADIDTQTAAGIFTTAMNAAVQMKAIETGLQEVQMQSSANIQAAQMGANASMYSADKYADASKYGADTSAGASRYGSDRLYAGTVYSSGMSSSATKYASNKANEASFNAAQKAYDSAIDAANIHSDASKYGSDVAASSANKSLVGNSLQITGSIIAAMLGKNLTNRR